MNIFISENDSKDSIYDSLLNTLDITKFKDELSDIFKKANNNYVGYYLFESGSEYYKVFVLPKHMKKPIKNDSKEIENQVIKKFVEYMKIHYKLKAKYSEKYNISSLNLNSTLELAFDSNAQNKQAQDLEQFVFYKYQSLLKDILKFFDTHKSHKRVKQSYTSQTVKYNINLKNNINEPNKTKIHQDRYEDIVFSKIATLSFGAIKLFLRYKVQNIEDEKQKDTILFLASKVKNILQKKYQIDKGFNLNISKLLSSKNYKYFKKSNDKLKLYSNLLALFGVEHFFDEESSKDINRSIKAESFFIRPEKLYEWIVYDNLKDKYLDFKLYKDELDDGTIKKYQLAGIYRNSKPDFVLKKDGEIIVVDAKWKILKSLEDIKFEDVAKLRRDSLINNATKSILAYPQVNFEVIENYQLEFDNFTFEIKKLFYT